MTRQTVIEQRKQLIRDVWEYKKCDHIPIMMSLDYNPWGYTTHDELYSHENQTRMRKHAVEQSLAKIPGDYIPSVFVNVGCVGISEAFGCTVYKGENEWQTPGVKGHLLSSPDDIGKLQKPDLRRANTVRDYLERLAYMRDAFAGEEVYFSGLDTNGPMGVAMDILGSEGLYTVMVDAPEDLLYLLGMISEFILEVIDASIRVLGGLDAFTSTDFFYCWCPEGYKGHMSSDLCATYSPAFFRQFDLPANNPVYQKYGGGLLHNCGPNPCIFEYTGHTPQLKGVNLAYEYSCGDLANIKRAMRDKIVYFFHEGAPEEILGQYKAVADALAPDVIAIPVFSVRDEKTDIDELYGKFREISEAYAKKIW